MSDPLEDALSKYPEIPPEAAKALAVAITQQVAAEMLRRQSAVIRVAVAQTAAVFGYRATEMVRTEATGLRVTFTSSDGAKTFTATILEDDPRDAARMN